MPDRELKQLNPQIRDVQIGVRNLRNIKVYPPSLADQIKLMKIISEGAALWFRDNPEGEMSPEAIAGILAVIQTNIGDVLKILMGLEKKVQVDKVLKDLTNTQLANIIIKVLEDNFLGPVKNVKSLFESQEMPLGEMLSPSERPLPQSAKSTKDTD